MATEGKVNIGIERVVYALDDAQGNVGTTWKNLYGAVTCEFTPNESSNTFYADNMAYYVASGAANDEFSIELARLTKEAKEDLFGVVPDVTSGLNIELVNKERQTFTLGFQYAGDTDIIRGVKYGCVANRVTETHNTTTDSTEPDTVTLEGTASGKKFTVDGEELNILGGYVDNTGSTTTAFDSFYTKPPQPGVAPTA